MGSLPKWPPFIDDNVEGAKKNVREQKERDADGLLFISSMKYLCVIILTS